MALSTKNRIIEGTAELLVREGFSFITVDAISQYLGISKKTLYNHFENKYAIYIEAFSRDVENIAQGLNDLINAPNQNFLVKVTRVLNYGFIEIQKRSKITGDVSLGKIPLSILQTYRNKVMGEIQRVISLLVNEADNQGFKKTELSNEMLSHILLILVEGNILYRDLPANLDRMELFISSVRIVMEGALDLNLLSVQEEALASFVSV